MGSGEGELLTLLVRLTLGVVEVEYTVYFSSRNAAFVYPDSNWPCSAVLRELLPFTKFQIENLYPTIIQSHVPIGEKHDRLPSGLGKDWKYGALSGKKVED